jgi:hypothetical protein
MASSSEQSAPLAEDLLIPFIGTDLGERIGDLALVELDHFREARL